jgi:hypothetical protein
MVPNVRAAILIIKEFLDPCLLAYVTLVKMRRDNLINLNFLKGYYENNVALCATCRFSCKTCVNGTDCTSCESIN